MWKNYVKIFLAKLVLITVFFNSGLPSTYAQCDNCTVTGPTGGSVTVPAGAVMCFTSNADLTSLTIGNNSTVCIASGVTVTVNGISTTAGNNIKLDVYGTLTSNEPTTFYADVDLTVNQGATITIGGSGYFSDLYFNGADNNIYNFGTINCNVLTYGTASSTSIVENHGSLNIKSNMNLKGEISFLNANYIYVEQSFNSNPDGIYINCGTIETGTSFNLEGGTIVNTGVVYSAGGFIDVPAGSDIDNYGDIKVHYINLNGGSMYNEGLVTLTGYLQGTANIAGPVDDSKLGYIVVGSAGSMNNGTVGPNLNFKNSSLAAGTTTKASVFGGNWASINYLSGVTFDCEASGNCAAPMVNSGYPCPLLNPQLTKTVDLTYDADGNGLVTVGDELTYTITLVNGGLISATGVSISDDLSGLSALTCFPASGATLRPAETMTCTATYTVTSDDESRGYAENQSVMIYNEGPDVLSDDPNTPELNDPTVIFVEKVEESTPISDSDDSPSGRFTVKKSADKNLVPAEGANVNYTYEVTNNTDRELYYISGSDNKCNINLQGGIYRRNVWGIGSYVYYLPAGKTATWTCSSYITQTTTNTATFTFANSYSVDLFGVVRYSGSESASASLTVRRQLPTGINDCNTLLFSSDEKGNSFPNGIVGLLNADGSTTTVFDIQAQTNSSGLEGTATMAMNPSDPSKIYYIPREDLSQCVNCFGGLYVYNAATDLSTELSPANSTPDVVRLGIDPHGLIWTVDSDGKAWSFNTGTNTWTDRGTISLPSGYSWNNLKSGDLTFDGNGIMYLVASDNTNYVGQLFTLTQQELLDGSPAATFVGTMGSNQYNGISFTENGDLYASSASDAGSVLYTIDIATGEASTYKTLNNYYITDLGSCALPKPEISVTKVASPTSFVSQGDEITYTINVCNRGTLPASGSYLTDQLPANVTYVAGSTTLNGTNVADINGASPLATKILVNSSASGAGRIAPGECAVVTFKVKVNIVCGSICNSASFNYTGVASPIISDDPRQPGGQDQTCNTVQPDPLDLSPATQNICSGQNMTPITIAGDLGGTVTWSSDVLGLSGSGRTIDAGSLINNGTDPYTVTIMVESELPGGCSSINSATITVLPEPQLTIDHSYISVCDYEPVNITATPVPSGNNTGVFTTTVPAGLTDNGDGTATLDVSEAGAGTFEVTYTYTDIDGNACVNSETVTVKVFDSPVVSVSSVKNVLCKGESTGSAVFTITGGTSSYNLSGDIEATNVTSPYTAIGLSAGTYQVTVTDANNCSATASVPITEPTAALEASVTSGTLSCNAGTTSLTVTASGGTPDYEYSLDNITYQSSNEFTVSSGSYVVYVKDANGCMFTVPSYTVPYACLTATKTAAESSYSAVNDEINYTITVSNSGNVTIDNVVVTDKNADAAPTYVSGDTNDNGIMEVGEIWTYSAIHTVTQADLDAGHVDNVASATGEDTSDNPVSDDSDEVTIDAIQTIIINDVSVVEGNDLVFTISLTGISTTDVTFVPVLSDGTAIIGTDTETPIQYSNDGGKTWMIWTAGDPVIIIAGETELLFKVPSIDDNIDELDEDFEVAVGVTNGNTLNTSVTATGTIEDDDTAAVASVTAATATEGTNLTHTVTMTNESATDAVYAFIVTDVTATKDVDYTGTPVFSDGVYDNGDGTITVPAGVTEFTVTFPGLPDDLDENDETYTLSIGGEEATGTIEDDDTAAVASVTAATATEGDDLTHTVTMSTASATDEVYAFIVTDVTATKDVDYTGTPVFSDGVYDNGDGTITVPAGVTGFTVTFPGLPDDLDENDETYTLSIGGEEATGTIEDDDTAAVASVTAATATEGDDLTHTVTMSTASAIDEVYAFIVTDVTATKDVDYTGTPVFSDGVYDNGDGTITVPAGVTEFTVTFPGLPDDLDENDETYTLSIGGEEATGTIEDDDTAAVASVTAATATEGDDLTHTVTMSTASATDEVYAFIVTDVTATKDVDYTGTPVFSDGVYDNGDGTITVPAGVTGFTVTFPGLPDDLDENDETYTLSIGGEEATGTITDDNASSLTISKTQIAGPSSVNTVGQIITYSIIITNTGDAIITGIVPTETYPGSGAGTLSAATESISTNGVLDVGETWTYMATYTTTQADVDAALPLVNMISVVTIEVPGPTTDTETTSVSQSPNITVTKSATESSYSKVGDILNYTITVSNSGNVTIDNVVVSDTKADAGSLSYVSGDDGDNLLQVGEEWIYSAIHTVTQSDLGAGSFVNVASVTGDDPEDNPVSDDTPPVTVSSDQSPNITVTKSATESSYSKVGDVLNYTITVSNSGNVTINNVVVSDTKADAGSLSYVSGDDGDNLLQVGEEWIYSAIHTVTQSDLDAGSFVNVASVTGDDPEDNPVSDDTPPVTVIYNGVANSTYAQNDFNNTYINTSVSGNVLTNDEDFEGDNIAVTTPHVISELGVEVSIDPLTGGYLYTPLSGYVGSDKFEYTICDDGDNQACDAAVVYISILPSGIECNNCEGRITSLTLRYEGETETAVKVIQQKGDNAFEQSVAPEEEFEFYGTEDATLGTEISIYTDDMLNVTIHTSCSQPIGTGMKFGDFVIVEGYSKEGGPLGPGECDVYPVANLDNAFTLKDEAVSGNLTENDFDPDGDVVSINTTPVELPDNGTVIINSDGTYIYTPDSGFIGEDFFVYEICDLDNLCSNAIVNITVLPVSTNITQANDDAYNGEVNSLINGNVLANDFDNEDDSQYVTSTVAVSDQGVTVSIDPVTGEFSYIPLTDYVGSDRFIYSVCDDGNPQACDDATVYLIVGGAVYVNTTYAVNDTIETIAGVEVSGNVMDNDYDLEGDNQKVSTITVISSEGVEVRINPGNGDFSYIPPEGFGGVDTFRYTVCDDNISSACDEATVLIIVYLDSDNDGVADNIDVDDDNDGILDIIEEEYALDQTSLDSDGDGIVDRLDIDADNDGIVDNVEWQSTIAEGGEYDYIFPLGTDSNGDGWDDAYDPASNGITYEPWDMDLDGTPDYLDTNTDNEGEDDNVEGWDEFPNDSIADVSYIGSDADKDGLDDAYDTYNTTTEEWAPGQNAIGSDAYLQDTDDDAVRDWRDAVDDRTPPEQFACGDPVIPNAFSPNQDGYNDYFKIMIYCTGTQGGNEERVLGDDFSDARIEIFNRWGNLVYEQERYGDEDYWGDVDAWWNGTSMNDMQVGGNQLPTATYYYILYFNDGKREPITGFVFLNN